MAKNPETVFKEKVFKDLNTIPDIWYAKTEAGAVHGIPEVMGCIRNNFFVLELKKDAKAKRSKLQLRSMAKIGGCGSYVAFTYPENWKLVLDELRGL